MSAKLKIMSFNLRVPSKKDGINEFKNRKERIMEVINTESPDLIGFQEATNKSRAWLIESLSPEYTVVGCGRNADYRGESTVLAFKNEKILMVSAETFWLSPTPHIPATIYSVDQSSCPRICTVACLKHEDADEHLWFYNTHLDHVGKQARLLEVAQIMEHISTHTQNGCGKFVITGDMNALPMSPEMVSFTTFLSDRTVVDATANITGTFHGFGRHITDNSIKIDYIFTDAKVDSNESYKIEAEERDGIYVSDHTPVCAFIEIE